MRWVVEKPSYSLKAWHMLEFGAAGAASGWHTVEGADCAGLYALGRMSALEGSSGAQSAFLSALAGTGFSTHPSLSR